MPAEPFTPQIGPAGLAFAVFIAAVLTGIALLCFRYVWLSAGGAGPAAPDHEQQACALTRPAPDIRPWLPLDDDPRDDGGASVEPPPFLAQSWPALPPAPPEYVGHGIARLERYLKEHTS